CDLLNLVLVQIREKRHMLEDFNNLSRRESDHRLCFLKNSKHAARRVIVSYESSRVYRACAPPRWPIRSPDLILANVGVRLESHCTVMPKSRCRWRNRSRVVAWGGASLHR